MQPFYFTLLYLFYFEVLFFLCMCPYLARMHSCVQVLLKELGKHKSFGLLAILET